MRFIVKLVAANIVIVAATLLSRRMPAAGGLIATMPLTSLVVLLWLYDDTNGDGIAMTAYARGALLGIGPAILFFAVATLLFSRGTGLAATLGIAGTAWLTGAAIHQIVLR